MTLANISSKIQIFRTIYFPLLKGFFGKNGTTFDTFFSMSYVFR